MLSFARQILHYKDGEKYEPHHDFFHDTVNARPENGGQRIATVLIYLCATVAHGMMLLAPNVHPAPLYRLLWSLVVPSRVCASVL